jgi:hypothetical protein
LKEIYDIKYMTKIILVEVKYLGGLHGHIKMYLWLLKVRNIDKSTRKDIYIELGMKMGKKTRKCTTTKIKGKEFVAMIQKGIFLKKHFNHCGCRWTYK